MNWWTIILALSIVYLGYCIATGLNNIGRCLYSGLKEIAERLKDKRK